MNSNDVGYLLHTRPYRETSQIITVLTRDHGRFSLVHRGARGRKVKGALQPFSLAQLSWMGRSDLKTLQLAETLESRFLSGHVLYIGFYLNELLMRLLEDGQPLQIIFDYYHHLILALGRGDDVEPALRQFEFSLLRELGYGFSLTDDARTGEPIEAQSLYTYDPEAGLTLAPGSRDTVMFSGADLLALGRGELKDPAVRLAAKKLTRLALAPHLGSKPLLSRELFRGSMPGNSKQGGDI